MFRFPISLLLILSLNSTVIAQSIWYDSEILEKDNVLKNFSFVFQDKQGYWWGLNSKAELARFNGFDIKSYNNGKLADDRNSYNCTTYGSFVVDSQGCVWFGTPCGLHRFNPQLEQFTNFTNSVKDGIGSIPFNYPDIIEDRNKRIWFATQQGVIYYDPKVEEFNLLDIAAPYAMVVLEDHQGFIWFGNVDVKEGTIQFSKIHPKTFAVEEKSNVIKISFDAPAYGNRQKFRFINSDGEHVFIAFNSTPLLLNTQNASLTDLGKLLNPNEFIRTYSPNLSDHLIVGTNLGRIISYDFDRREFYPLLATNFKDDLRSIFVDYFNNLWVKTQNLESGGVRLYKVEPASKTFEFFKFPKKYSGTNGEPDRITKINGGAYFVYPDSFIPIDINVPKIELSFPFLQEGLNYKIEKDNEGARWLVAYPFDKQHTYFLRLDEDWNITYFKSCLNRIEADCFTTTFRDIAFDRNNHLWAAGWDGIIKLDHKLDSVQVFGKKAYSTDTINLLKEEKVLSLQPDGAYIWIGYNSEGISRFDLNTQKFEHFDSLTVDGIPLYNKGITDIHKDSEDNVWFATQHGLFRYLAASGDFEAFSTADGLGGNWIVNLFEDQQGEMWVGEDESLNKFDREKSRFYSFDFPSSPQFKNYLINENAFYLHHFSKGREVILKVRADSLKVNTHIPPMKLEALLVSNTLVTPNDSTGILKKSLNFTDTIILSYQQNSLTIRYAALEYLQPESINFAYRLEDYIPGWQYAGQDRAAVYTNVPPGTYTFEVKCQNNHGFWGEPRTLTIQVLPPWWRTWWAYTFYSLATLALFYGLYRFQLRRQLAFAETKRLQELENVRTRLYTNITHEFRTPLTIIQSMADQIMRNPKEKLLDGYQMIKRNSNRLFHLVNQMLDLSKLESGTMPLHPVQSDVIRYLQYICESFRSLAEGKEIGFHFSAGEPGLTMDYDPGKLMEVMSNLIANAVKFTPEGGQVYVEVKTITVEEKPYLQIMVEDTGVGIAQKDLSHIFDRFYQADESATRKGEGTGIGLALTRELVKLMNGRIRVDSRLGEGSVFTVQLPITRNAEVQSSTSEDGEVIPGWLEVGPAITAPDYAALDTGRPQLLIIEDNLDVIYLLVSMLQHQYQLYTATDGQMGIDRALELVPDIIISDIMMPVKDGYEVCSTLKQDERTSHIPIILLTAKADTDSRISGIRRGADAYLAKPFNEEELKVRLGKLIELRRQLQERYRGGHLKELLPSPQHAIEDEFLQKVRAQVDAHLTDSDFDIVKLAQLMGMGRVQLYRKIKALTDSSPSIFVRTVRLEHARRQLLASQLNISEVAYAVGFNDPAFFSRSFQETYGKSPTQFREDRG